MLKKYVFSYMCLEYNTFFGGEVLSLDVLLFKPAFYLFNRECILRVWIAMRNTVVRD